MIFALSEEIGGNMGFSFSESLSWEDNKEMLESETKETGKD